MRRLLVAVSISTVLFLGAGCSATTSTGNAAEGNAVVEASTTAVPFMPTDADCPYIEEGTSTYTEGVGFATAQDALETESAAGLLPDLDLLQPVESESSEVATWQVVREDGLITAQYTFLKSNDGLWNFVSDWRCSG